MSDSPFQRPGSTPPEARRATQGARGHDDLQSEEDVVVDISPVADRWASRSSLNPGARKTTAILTAGAAGVLVGGLGVAALTVGPPTPDPIVLSVDSFPREVLGLARDDVAFRDVGAKEAEKRLDAQFQDQLAGYRFAYGGDGARLTYHMTLALTIVNARLAPRVPTAGDVSVGEMPIVVGLRTDDTLCVSDQPAVDPPDPVTTMEVTNEDGTTSSIEFSNADYFVETECVLFDAERNLSLRLTGSDSYGAGDPITLGQSYSDELHRIHADLIG